MRAKATCGGTGRSIRNKRILDLILVTGLETTESWILELNGQ